MIDSMKYFKRESANAARAEAGSLELEALFLEHWTSVYQILRRLVGDPAEAEDLALEAFLRLYRHNQKKPKVENAGGWLYRVATRLGLNSIREWKRREQYELTAVQYALEETTQLSPAEILAQKEEWRQVRLVLAGMKERQSQLLILRYSGFSYKEIANALNVAPSSIGPLLVRAEGEFEKKYRALAQGNAPAKKE